MRNGHNCGSLTETARKSIPSIVTHAGMARSGSEGHMVESAHREGGAG